MKYKILSTLLCAVVLLGTFALIKYLPADFSSPEEESRQTEESASTEEQKVVSRAFVIETAHDAEDLMKRLAYGEPLNYKKPLGDLVNRLQASADYLKNELQDFVGSGYFSVVSGAFYDVISNPYASSSDFSTRVAKTLTELENAYPEDIAAELDENHPETPMYYPAFDTTANGTTSLALLRVYRQQYQENNNCILLTFGGNLIVGDTLLGAEDENSFKTLSANSKYPFPLYRLSSVLNSDSASFANLESPLTNAVGGAESAGSVKGLPDYAKLIKNGGVEVLSVANGGVLSFGAAGKSDTLSALKSADIQYSDEGVAAFYQTPLGTVCYLSYNIIDEIRDSVNKAYEEAPKADIAAAKQNGAKFVIVHFNWVNTENRPWDPCMNQVLTTRAAVDNGADLVLGTHPNSIEAIEKYKGVSIVYSPGNLSNRNGEGYPSFIFQQAFTLNDNGKAVPGEIQVFPLSGAAEGTACPSLVLDANGAASFLNTVKNASSTVRYGVGRKGDFPTDSLNLISIKK